MSVWWWTPLFVIVLTALIAPYLADLILRYLRGVQK